MRRISGYVSGDGGGGKSVGVSLPGANLRGESSQCTIGLRLTLSLSIPAHLLLTSYNSPLPVLT